MGYRGNFYTVNLSVIYQYYVHMYMYVTVRSPHSTPVFTIYSLLRDSPLGSLAELNVPYLMTR